MNTTDFSEYPYKYFTNLVPGNALDLVDIFNAVCVKKCPKQGETPECMINSDASECPDNNLFDTELKGSFCLPEGDDVKDILKVIYDNLSNQSNFGKYMADLQSCWQAMLGMCIATFFISLLYIFLLKWITKPLLYISMVSILICFVLLGGWAWMKAASYDPELEKDNR